MSSRDRVKYFFAAMVGLIAGLFLTAVLDPGEAHADMCGPSNLPVLSYLNPWVKGCQVYLPGAGNLPQLPVVPPPPNAPYPVWTPPWGSWVRP